MPPFIFTGRHTKTRDKKREAHRAECKSRDLPTVVILQRRQFADVFVDTLTQQTPLSQKQIDRIELLFGEFGEDGGRLVLTPSRCWCDKVRLEHAQPLATELWRVAIENT